MKAALNFSPQAIDALRTYPYPDAPVTRIVSRWAADLLEKAEVFILPDCGQLLDRSRPKPEVPGTMFRPPFDIVACEYLAQHGRSDTVYSVVSCSRRIALAWDWRKVDLPPPLCFIDELRSLPDGVGVLSLFYVDHQKAWGLNGAAVHVAYDGQWQERSTFKAGAFEQAMIASGNLPSSLAKARGYENTLVPLALEQCARVEAAAGSRDAAYDLLRADGNDELIAYIDLCYALGCKNVTAQRFTPSQTLNAERRRKRRPQLKDWHVLDLGAGSGSSILAAGDRGSPRSHLRRGHIRRIGPERMTWVNQTMVTGRGGFVDKTYRARSLA